MQSVAEKLYSVVCVLRKDYCLGLCLDRSLHFSLRATSSLAPWHLVALDTKKFDFWLFLQLHKTCHWWQALPFSAILFIFNKCLLLTYTGIGFRIYFSLDGWMADFWLWSPQSWTFPYPLVYLMPETQRLQKALSSEVTLTSLLWNLGSYSVTDLTFESFFATAQDLLSTHLWPSAPLIHVLIT